jgi:multicomponent Na+:H+ antiporter subunit F
MSDFFTVYAGALTLIVLLPLVRVLRGPTVFDRLLGVSAVGGKTVVLICLLGRLYGREGLFMDIAIAYAVLGFISVIALAEYFEKAR